MKQLLGITFGGAAALLLIILAAKAGFNMMHGRPIAHATELAAILLRDTLTILIMILWVIGSLAWWRFKHPGPRSYK
jgi:hypothetical protein